MAYEENPNWANVSKTQEKRSDKAPDYWGNIEISEELIRSLAFKLKNGEKPMLKIGLWRKENSRGVYLRLNLSEPRTNNYDQRPPQSRPQRQASQQGGGQKLQPRQQQYQEEDPLDDEVPF